MPKILGMEEVTNFEVLKWIRDTKKRHAEEDAQYEAEGLVLKPRPLNFKQALEKHERHLTKDFYPYEKNPSIYNENYDIDEACQKLNVAVVERVHRPIQKKYRDKVSAKEMTLKEAEEAYDKETDPKLFTEMEIMMLHNLAPKGMEALQLIIEQWEERFTEEEMSLVLEAVADILRPDEQKK